MRGARIVGMIAIALGLVLFGISYYIQSEIDRGLEIIAEAEQKLKTGQSLFGLNAVTKIVGKPVLKEGKKKLAAAETKIAYYQQLVNRLQPSGVVAIAMGGILLLVTLRQKKTGK